MTDTTAATISVTEDGVRIASPNLAAFRIAFAATGLPLAGSIALLGVVLGGGALAVLAALATVTAILYVINYTTPLYVA